MKTDVITLNYGSGGALTKKLIDNLFLKYFKSDELHKLSDSAILKLTEKKIAFTTDSFVIKPIFFPGGNIGKLSICGTVNDLSVQGAIPLYISAGFILEEGFNISELEIIVRSMAETAAKAGVEIVTGDTKVVEKGKCDGIYINTAGIGIIKNKITLPLFNKIKDNDKIIVSGTLGDHSIAVLSKREGFDFKTNIRSDCACLNKIIESILIKKIKIKFIRDITRGGLATILNELVQQINNDIVIYEKSIPVKKEVNAICELLGFNPLYLANEGKLLIVVDSDDEEKLIDELKNFNESKSAKSIGKIMASKEKTVILENNYGIRKILDMLTGEQLPRIC